MSARVWVFQRPEQVKALGAEHAPYYCGWYEPSGKRKSRSCGAGFRGKKKAEALQQRLEAELLTGTYQQDSRKSWDDFVKELEARVLAGKSASTRSKTLTALATFKRLVKPIRVLAVTTQLVDEFTAARRKEAGKKKGDTVSPATINRDLRHLRAALRYAVEWGYLAHLPRFRMERVPRKLPTYVSGDDFALLYAACDKATMPRGQAYPGAEWWRALLATAYLTGWRISELLALRREDLDLEGGYAVTRARDNKGRRDERVKLHPVVVEHLGRLPGFSPVVFPWPHNVRTLYSEFYRIQKAAGVNLPCPEEHEHTDACHYYGFHDLRRAFATMNADKLTADALQSLMRHKSYQTTQVYINLARQMDEAVNKLHVPDVLRTAAGG